MKMLMTLLFSLFFAACTFDTTITNLNGDGTPGGGSGGSGGSGSGPIYYQELNCTDYDNYTGPTRIYRSVGPQNSASLTDGSSNSMTISNSIATFDQPLPVNIGVGDAIEYDSDNDNINDTLAFIHCRHSKTDFIIKNQDGTSVADMAVADSDWLAYRAYRSLANAESGTVNSSIAINFDSANNDGHWNVGQGRDLVSANEIWHIAAYADDIDTTKLTISSWTTGASNYLRIFTPSRPSEVGVSQRHDGRWLNSAFSIILDPVTTNEGVINPDTDFVRIEGLQIGVEGNNPGAAGIDVQCQFVNSNSGIQISGNIIKKVSGSADYEAGISVWSDNVSANNSRVKIWNNIIYDFDDTNFGAGLTVGYGCTPTVHAYNNTSVDNFVNFQIDGLSGNPVFVLKNNIDYRPVWSNGYWVANGASYNPTSSNNLFGSAGWNPSIDPPGSGDRADVDVQFVDYANDDFRLGSSDAGAKGYGVNLSSDPNLAVVTDIDGQLRPTDTTNWDIGADQTGMILSANLSAGQFYDTIWEAGNSWVNLDSQNPTAQELSDNKANTWVNMNGNLMLYHLNETGTPTTFTDTSGSGNDATCTTCPTPITDGYFGGAMDFDGVDDFIDLPMAPAVGEQTFSVAFWVRTNDTVACSGNLYTCPHLVAIDAAGTGSDDFALVLADGKLGAWHGLNGGVDNFFTTELVVADGQWHHIYFMRSTTFLNFYVDGVEAFFGPSSYADTSGLVNDTFTLGALHNDVGTMVGHVDADIDEFAYWDRSLRGDDMLLIYLTQKEAKLSQVNEFPETGTNDPWIDMTGNVLLLHFNETNPFNNPVIYDTSPSGLTGANSTSDSQININGVVGMGHAFDGANDNIVFTNTPELQLSGAMTLSAWIRPLENSSMAFISKRDFSGNRGYNFMTLSGASGPTLYFGVASDASTAVGANTTEELTLASWYHVVGVFRPNQAVQLYVDGKLAAENTTGIPSSQYSTDNDLRLGRPSGGCCGYAGAVDEVAIWSRDLSTEEIKKIYDRQGSSFSGYYESEIFDAGTTVSWDKLSWEPERPTGKEIVLGDESSIYGTGGLNNNNLVGLWHLNGPEQSISAGTNILDSSGTGNHGTAVNTNGTGMAYEKARLDKGIRFDGVDDYISIADSATLDITGDVTVAAWIKINDSPSPSVIAVKGGGEPYRLSIQGNTPALFKWRVSLTPSGVQDVVGTIPVKANVWYHIVGVRQLTESRLYVNGVRDGPNLSIPADSIITNNDPFSLAGSGVPESSDVTLDEVGLWSRALNPTEIADLYKRGAVRLRYQVRSCSGSCTNEAFYGPDGSSSTYYSEITNPISGLPNIMLNHVPDNRFFQFRAYSDTYDNSVTPKIKSANVEVSP